MITLIIISVGSLSALLYMFGKKLYEVEAEIDTPGAVVHTNFIADFFYSSRDAAQGFARDNYLKIRPHAHDLAAGLASRMYKLNSWIADEFLKLHNFIQGRKVLKSSGRASVFIRDMARDNEKLHSKPL